jgi:hypothetical protein
MCGWWLTALTLSGLTIGSPALFALRRRSGLAVGGVPVLFAKPALEARLTTVLRRADLVAWLGHLASLPESVMLATVMFRDSFAAASLGFTRAFSRHVLFHLNDDTSFKLHKPSASSRHIPSRRTHSLYFCQRRTRLHIQPRQTTVSATAAFCSQPMPIQLSTGPAPALHLCSDWCLDQACSEPHAYSSGVRL